MTIEKTDFDSITGEDLKELVDGRVPEGMRLEYKSTQYGNTDANKRELLKDVSAFANTQGGHLILGMAEQDGVAHEIIGLDDIDCDAEILRMEQILRNGLQPSIPGLRMKSVTLANDKSALVLRVLRSWHPPHRVVANGSNKFYVRNSGGVHEPDIEELRALFTQSSSALEQARRFRDERIELVTAGEGLKPLEGSGRLFLHIVPTAAFSGMIQLDLEQVYQMHNAFWPIGSNACSPRYNYHGFANERGGELNHGYTQIFRNGCLEAVMAKIVREREGRLTIPGLGLEEYLFARLSNYIMGLSSIGVPPPLIIMITIEGVVGATYKFSNNLWEDYETPLMHNPLILPECVLEDYGTIQDHHKTVQPAFDALYNSIGLSGCPHFNDDGEWVGHQQN